MRLLVALLIVTLAGCTTTPGDPDRDPGPDPVPGGRAVPDPIDLAGSFGPQSEGLVTGDGRCPEYGDCTRHDFTLDDPATMRIELDVVEGAVEWGLWRGDDQLMSDAVTGHWEHERHLAAGVYQVVLHSADVRPTQTTGTLSWYHAFPPGGQASPPEDFHENGTWPAGHVDPFYGGECLTCEGHRFNVTGTGYGTVAMSARLTWGATTSSGGLYLVHDGETVAQAGAGFPDSDRRLDVVLFPGEYELQVSGISAQEQDWSLRVRFD